VVSSFREALDEACDGAERVRRIVLDLKAFSRSDETTLPVDVRAVLETSLAVARHDISSRATLVSLLAAVPCVAANEGRLGQVFLNLLVNAAQAIPEGDPSGNEVRVTTAWADSGARVVVEISDTGCGIPPENVERIFDPFFTTKPAGVGTGLGLAISRRIVASLGGEIEVQTAVGKGSTFRVTLPSMTATAADSAQ
jgi:signal transduction histidine kinase